MNVAVAYAQLHASCVVGAPNIYIHQRWSCILIIIYSFRDKGIANRGRNKSCSAILVLVIRSPGHVHKVINRPEPCSSGVTFLNFMAIVRRCIIPWHFEPWRATKLSSGSVITGL